MALIKISSLIMRQPINKSAVTTLIKGTVASIATLIAAANIPANGTEAIDTLDHHPLNAEEARIDRMKDSQGDIFRLGG